MLSNAIRFIDLLLAYILSFIVVFTTINIITCYYDHIYWVTTTYYLLAYSYVLSIGLILHYISRLAITDYLLSYHYKLSFGLYLHYSYWTFTTLYL